MRLPNNIDSKAVDPDRLLNYLGQALRLGTRDLPARWGQLTEAHIDLLEERFPLGGQWTNVGVCPIPTPVRTIVLLGKKKSRLYQHALMWKGSPMLCMDKTSAMSLNGLFMVMPRRLMDAVLAWSAAPHIVNPSYLDGVACVSLRQAIDHDLRSATYK